MDDDAACGPADDRATGHAPQPPGHGPHEGGPSGAPLPSPAHAAPRAAPGGRGTFEREAEVALLDRIDADLAAVDRALERLSQGTYGTCEVCATPLGTERLAADPVARLCPAHGTAPDG
ncbi:MAG TPA: hypothetical protein VFW63_07845 [Acidimicrobiales bacterium]|nr:hypothetical protein [Acidimicrobiales bacterium]